MKSRIFLFVGFTLIFCTYEVKGTKIPIITYPTTLSFPGNVKYEIIEPVQEEACSKECKFLYYPIYKESDPEEIALQQLLWKTDGDAILAPKVQILESRGLFCTKKCVVITASPVKIKTYELAQNLLKPVVEDTKTQEKIFKKKLK